MLEMILNIVKERKETLDELLDTNITPWEWEAHKTSTVNTIDQFTEGLMKRGDLTLTNDEFVQLDEAINELADMEWEVLE